MAFNFPIPVAVGDEFTDPAGVTYTWTGVGWAFKLTPSSSLVIADTAPPAPTEGMLWWESDSGILWLWYVDVDGGQWVQAAGSSGGGASVSVGDTAPASPAQGDLWWESDTAILWIWYVDADSSQWVQAAGSTGGSGGTVDAYTKAESDAKYVELVGDTMTGSLNIVNVWPGIGLDRPDASTAAQVAGRTGGLSRWGLVVATNEAEGGLNTGSNFQITRYDDAGMFIDTPVTINRATGNTTMNGALIVPNVTTLGVTLNNPAGSFVVGEMGGLIKWGVELANDFRVWRYDDAGVANPVPSLAISRSNGEIYLGGNLYVGDPILNAGLTLNKQSGINIISGRTNNLGRWAIYLGNAVAEGGANSGSDFQLDSHNDDGSYKAVVIQISRASSVITFSGMLNMMSMANYWDPVSGYFAISGPAYKPGGGDWTALLRSDITTVVGDYTRGLAAIQQLNPVRYTYRGNDSRVAPEDGKDARTHKDVLGREFIGLVAEDAEVVMPELITNTPGYVDGQAVSDLRSLDSTAITYALINAVKELSAEIEALKAQIAQPRGR